MSDVKMEITGVSGLEDRVVYGTGSSVINAIAKLSKIQRITGGKTVGQFLNGVGLGFLPFGLGNSRIPLWLFLIVLLLVIIVFSIIGLKAKFKQWFT